MKCRVEVLLRRSKGHQPLSVPSSPMIIFIDDMICMTTGGDMKEAYVALCEQPLI